MPADKFTKNADTPRRKKMWDNVYHDSLARGTTEGSAIRSANAAVKRDKESRKTNRKLSTRMKRGPVATGIRG